MISIFKQNKYIINIALVENRTERYRTIPKADDTLAAMIAARNSCMHSWRQGVPDTLAAMTTAVSGSDYTLSCYLDTVLEQRHCTPSPSNRCKQTEGCGCCPESRAISNMLEFNKRHTLLPSSHHFAGSMNCGQQLLLVYHPRKPHSLMVTHKNCISETGPQGKPRSYTIQLFVKF